MKKSRRNIFTVILVIAAFLLITSSAYAAAPLKSYFDFGQGNYSYSYNDHKLTFGSLSPLKVLAILYADGISSSPALVDPLRDTLISIGDLYNSNANPLIFGPFPGGATGPVAFSIDGTSLTADLDSFTVQTGVCSGFAGCVNPDYAIVNLTNVSTNTAIGSRYLNEISGTDSLMLQLNFSGNVSFDETCPDGICSGSAFGKVSFAPEPVSAILFLTGGATLAARRYWKRKKK